MLAIRLPPDIEDRGEKLARRTGRTKIYMERQVFLEHIDDLEDIHLAERRYAALIACKNTTTTLDEAERALGPAE